MSSNNPIFDYQVTINKVNDARRIVVYNDRIILSMKTMQLDLTQKDSDKVIMFRDIKQIDFKSGILGLNPNLIIILQNGDQEKIPTGYANTGKEIRKFIKSQI